MIPDRALAQKAEQLGSRETRRGSRTAPQTGNPGILPHERDVLTGDQELEAMRRNGALERCAGLLARQHPIVRFDIDGGGIADPTIVVGENVGLEAFDIDLDYEQRCVVTGEAEQIRDRIGREPSVGASGLDAPGLSRTFDCYPAGCTRKCSMHNNYVLMVDI